ncbi:MAG: thiamine phosphate synthase [Rhodospirillaceae bacterium]|nr:thiamine phosphate synthase [Rhodospirillaceae bacterium]
MGPAPNPTRCRLYILTPPAIPDPNAFSGLLEETLAAGDVASLQLRLKSCDDASIRAASKALMPICHAKEVAFILNDRPDLAAQLGCDGVHIGPEDTPYAEARRILGPEAIVGVSCKGSRHVAMDLADAGADYVAFGAFYPSTTKDVSALDAVDPEVLQIWSETTNVPCVAIGGITVENCEPLIAAGADFLAVSNGIWGYTGGPAAAVRAFNAKFAAKPTA